MLGWAEVRARLAAQLGQAHVRVLQGENASEHVEVQLPARTLPELQASASQDTIHWTMVDGTERVEIEGFSVELRDPASSQPAWESVQVCDASVREWTIAMEFPAPGAHVHARVTLRAKFSADGAAPVAESPPINVFLPARLETPAPRVALSSASESVTVSWQSQVPELQHTVRWSREGDSEDKMSMLCVDAGENTVTLPLPNTQDTFCFSVKSHYGSRSSDWSEPIPASLAQRPAPPVLFCARQTDRSCVLEWEMAACVPPLQHMRLLVADHPEQSFDVALDQSQMQLPASEEALHVSLRATLADGTELSSQPLTLQPSAHCAPGLKSRLIKEEESE